MISGEIAILAGEGGFDLGRGYKKMGTMGPKDLQCNTSVHGENLAPLHTPGTLGITMLWGSQMVPSTLNYKP